MTNKIEYVLDTNTGELFEHKTTVSRVCIPSSKLIGNIENIEVIKLDDENYSIFKFKGGKLNSRWSVHIPKTILIRHPLIVEADGEHLHASDDKLYYDLILDRPLLLRNFDVTTNSGETYRCKPFFMVRDGGNNILSDNELDRDSYFYYVGVDSNGKSKLFIPPLSNVYDDGRMCNGGSVMRGRTPKTYKAEQLREHFELSMSNCDLMSGSLTKYARWDLNEVHSPLAGSVLVNSVSGSQNEIVQSVVDYVRGVR